jgi:integrase
MSDERVKRHRRCNNGGCTFKPGARLPEKLRAAGDVADARAAEARLAKSNWYITYTTGVGRTSTECAHTTVRAEAEALLRKRLDAIGRGERDPRAMEKVLVQNLFDDVLLDYRANGYASLGDATVRIKKHLGPFFGARRACHVSNANAQEYIIARTKAGASLATVSNELSLLRRALHLGVQNRKLAVAGYIGLPKNADVPRKGFVEIEQYRALISYLPSHLKAIVSMAFFSAMRKGELLGLKWSQVDLAEGFIRLTAEETKTRQARTVPIAAEPLPMLRMEKLRRDREDPTCDSVFFRERMRNVDGEGSALVPLGDFGKAWEHACVAAGLGQLVQVGTRMAGRGKKVEKPVFRYRGLIFHDLRRSGVRQLIRSGVHEHVAMKISGHRTRSIFQRYDIVSEADLRDAVRKVDERLSTSASSGEHEIVAVAQPAVVVN